MIEVSINQKDTMAQKSARTGIQETAPTDAPDVRHAESIRKAGASARKALGKDYPDADILNLQSAIAAVFESWKQQHGDRNPTEMRNARGSLAAVRKPILFADAAPYQCAGPTVANNI